MDNNDSSFQHHTNNRPRRKSGTSKSLSSTSLPHHRTRKTASVSTLQEEIISTEVFKPPQRRSFSFGNEDSTGNRHHRGRCSRFSTNNQSDDISELSFDTSIAAPKNFDCVAKSSKDKHGSNNGSNTTKKDQSISLEMVAELKLQVATYKAELDTTKLELRKRNRTMKLLDQRMYDMENENSSLKNKVKQLEKSLLMTQISQTKCNANTDSNSHNNIFLPIAPSYNDIGTNNERNDIDNKEPYQDFDEDFDDKVDDTRSLSSYSTRSTMRCNHEKLYHNKEEFLLEEINFESTNRTNNRTVTIDDTEEQATVCTEADEESTLFSSENRTKDDDENIGTCKSISTSNYCESDYGESDPFHTMADNSDGDKGNAPAETNDEESVSSSSSWWKLIVDVKSAIVPEQSSTSSYRYAFKDAHSQVS